MDTNSPPEGLAEVENAELAAEELARDGHTLRRCLRCGGDLVMERAGASYVIRCKQEHRVLLTSRGL